MTDEHAVAIERLKDMRKSREELRTASRRRRARALMTVGVALATVVIAAILLPLVLQPPSEEQAANPRNAARTQPLQLSLQLVQVGEDLVANPPPGPPLYTMTWPDGVLAATRLGEMAGHEAIGILTDRARVCMILNDQASGSGWCIPYRDFESEGFFMDRGSWDIHWFADGRVEWTGL
jgi:hypothetical protein